jgi:endoglucanase
MVFYSKFLTIFSIGLIIVVSGFFGWNSWQLEKQLQIQPISSSSSSSIESKLNQFSFGVVDPDQKLSKEVLVEWEHFFVPWGPKNYENTKKRLSAANTSRNLLITLEPWNNTPDEDIFTTGIRGDYDEYVGTLCSYFGTLNRKKTILRFAHEMDVAKSVYPWSTKDTKRYIQLFQRITSVCKTKLPKVKIMWSPNGELGAESYYPGDEYVDIAGLSAYGYPEFEMKTYGKVLTFQEMFEPKWSRLKNINKPVVIAEFGVAGSDSFKTEYVKTAFQEWKTTPGYSKLQGVIYFYYFNKEPWIPGIVAPDFRLPFETILTQVR